MSLSPHPKGYHSGVATTIPFVCVCVCLCVCLCVRVVIIVTIATVARRHGAVVSSGVVHCCRHHRHHRHSRGVMLLSLIVSFAELQCCIHAHLHHRDVVCIVCCRYHRDAVDCGGGGSVFALCHYPNAMDGVSVVISMLCIVCPPSPVVVW